VIGEVVTIAVFFLVIVITAVVFCVWVAVSVVRGIFSGIGRLFPPPRPRVSAASMVRCVNRGCGALNPSAAKFCRRCGHGTPAAQSVQVRRAAVW